MSERITLQITDDLRFVPKHVLGSWAEGDFVERQAAINVWQYVQDTVADHYSVGCYLAGPMGAGKSSIMYYVVQKARQLGWFVIYIPRCDSWVKSGLLVPEGWYSYFFDVVFAGLQFVGPEIKKKYEYCFPPEKYKSWEAALESGSISLQEFKKQFDKFRKSILKETAVEVLLAFDESQAIFEFCERPNIYPPFFLVDWSEYYQRGCVFVTGTADSPYCRSLREGHEQYIMNVGALSDAEFESWTKTKQFANIVLCDDYTEYIPEIRSLTGDIPRELVLLNNEFKGQSDSPSEILKGYSTSRRSAFEKRFTSLTEKYPQYVGQYTNAMMKFFIQVEVSADDVPLEFLDTGLAYIAKRFAVPLSMNAIKCFFHLLTKYNDQGWNNQLLHELQNLENDNMSQVVLAFERLFGLNLLSKGGSQITLNYRNLAGVKQQRCIQIRHFLTLPKDKPKHSWKDYPVGTLVAHSKAGEARLDFIYFGGHECILFFEVTVAANVVAVKYPQLEDNDRLELILSSVSKWIGSQMCVAENNNSLEPCQKTRGSYDGAVEYIVVSSRTPDEGLLHVGPQKKQKFAWLKLMDRNALAGIFPKSHIEQLQKAMFEKE